MNVSISAWKCISVNRFRINEKTPGVTKIPGVSEETLNKFK